MFNIESIINQHKHKTVRSNDTKRTCNCRNKLKGKYTEIIINGNETKEYHGSTGASIKKSYRHHKHSFKFSNNQQTTLSKYVRKNNSNNIEIILSTINRVSNMRPKKPDIFFICNFERMAIAKANREKSLNVSNELAKFCVHYKSSYFNI